jgi:hypothetical protein
VRHDQFGPCDAGAQAVSASIVATYVTLADKIRTQLGAGSP